MNWLSVDSRSLAAVAYRQDKRQLYVRFHSGKIYRYFGFPHDQYDELLAAKSKGSYFAADAAPEFDARRADTDRQWRAAGVRRVGTGSTSMARVRCRGGRSGFARSFTVVGVPVKESARRHRVAFRMFNIDGMRPIGYE